MIKLKHPQDVAETILSEYGVLIKKEHDFGSISDAIASTTTKHLELIEIVNQWDEHQAKKDNIKTKTIELAALCIRLILYCDEKF